MVVFYGVQVRGVARIRGGSSSSYVVDDRESSLCHNCVPQALLLVLRVAWSSEWGAHTISPHLLSPK